MALAARLSLPLKRRDFHSLPLKRRDFHSLPLKRRDFHEMNATCIENMCSQGAFCTLACARIVIMLLTLLMLIERHSK